MPVGKRSKGVPALNKKLYALREQTAAAVGPSMARAADLIVASQKNLAPEKTGALKNSIRWRWDAAATEKRLENRTRITIEAGGAEAFYAIHVEQGTEDTPAHPFFFPGYRASRKAAVRIIVAGVRQAVKQAVS